MLVNRYFDQLVKNSAQAASSGHQQKKPSRAFFSPDPRGPNFAEICVRLGRGLQPPDFRDLIPPLGHTLLHGEAEKLTRKVGVASPKAVPQRGGGRRTAGRFRRRAGQPSGVRAAHGGKNGRKRGKKPHTRAFSGFRGWARTGLRGGSRGFFTGRAGRKSGGAGAKRGGRAPFGGGYGGRWGRKSPFCREKGGQRGCGGAKTGGESWRGV